MDKIMYNTLLWAHMNENFVFTFFILSVRLEFCTDFEPFG